MMPESGTATNRIPEGRSVVVVSDLHLGGGEDPETAQRFCNFLDYITTDFTSVPLDCQTCQGTIAKSPGRTRMLLPPEKIILLGDILEVWDSRNVDRNSAFLDALLPFLKMREMDCDVIYVTGNHDEDIAEIVTSVDDVLNPVNTGSGKTGSCFWKSEFNLIFEPDENNAMRVEGVTIPWNPRSSRALEIRPRHYAPTGTDKDKRGIDSGSAHYAFLHGQQFDKEQITYAVSEALGQRFDPVDFLQDMASISASRQVGLPMVVLNVLLMAGLTWLLWVNPDSPLVLWVGFWFGLSLVVLFGYGTVFFANRYRAGKPSSATIAVICAILALSALVFLVFNGEFGLFLGVFFISVFLSITIAIPRLFAYLKRKAYTAISSKAKSPDEIIGKGFFGKSLFDLERYKYGAEVLVFGHTHIPDFGEVPAKGKESRKGPLLVNTGTWVQDSSNVGTDACDTFAYIDKTGVCCLRWVDGAKTGKGHIKCFCRKKDDTPLCQYF